MEKLIREMKAATRSLLRTKGYGLTVIITLSACIAVNVAIFAIVNSVLLRPLPVPNAQQIVLMSNRYPKAGVPDQYISSSGDYYDRLKYVTALQDQAEFRLSEVCRTPGSYVLHRGAGQSHQRRGSHNCRGAGWCDWERNL